MKWKILLLLDILLSTLTVISAGVLGNSLVAGHIPALHSNATWLSKSVIRYLTLPDSLADWALGSLPQIATLYLFGAFFLAELLLLISTPLLQRMITMAIARAHQQEVRTTYDFMRKNKTAFRPLRRRLLGHVTLRLAALSGLAFIIGLLAALIAWRVAALINANTGGIIQTAAVIFGVILLVFVWVILKEIVSAVVGDYDALDMLQGLAPEDG
jgi:hypothetical protein